MTVNTCPVCKEQFSATGTVHDHAWNVHGACYHCGEQFDDKETLYTHWLVIHGDKLSRVDRKRAESEVSQLTFKDQLIHKGPSAALGGIRRRTVLFAGGAAIAGGAAALRGGFGGSNRTDNSGTSDPGSKGRTRAVSTAPIPSAPDAYRYATMGTANTDVTITYFGNWKCPYCAQFSTNFLSTIIADYIVSGKIVLQFRNLTYVNDKPFLGVDAPAAARAGLAVWNNDPNSYWTYHEQVLRNQPPESKSWATPDTLISFARKAGINDPSVIRTAIQEKKYEEVLRATTQAAAEANVDGTPVLLINGTTVSPFKKNRTRQLIKNAIA